MIQIPLKHLNMTKITPKPKKWPKYHWNLENYQNTLKPTPKDHNESQKRPTQWNLSPIGGRNQRKYAPNPTPIRIRIPTCALVSILGITFDSDVQ